MATIYMRVILICLANVCTVKAQPAQSQDSLDLLLEKGIQLVAHKQYTAAVQLYSSILQQDEVVPSSICFHFGKALYHTHRLEEAKRFLHFYQLGLLQTSDVNEAAADSLLTHIQIDLQDIQTCTYCNMQGYRYQKHALCQGLGYLPVQCIACRGQQYTSCSNCFGQGVLIKIDVFGRKSYLDCTSCYGKGLRSCDRCQGKGKVQESCKACERSGQISTRIWCNHSSSP